MTYKLIGYFENWAQWRPTPGTFLPKDIDPLLLTHINYAFAFLGFITAQGSDPEGQVTKDYKVYPVEWNDKTLYGEIRKLGLKMLLSIGGWTFNDPTYDYKGIGRKTYELFSKMVQYVRQPKRLYRLCHQLC